MSSENTKILGHKKNQQILSNRITQKNIFPTWIFHGIDGIGKYNTAINFAKFLLTNITPTEGDFQIDSSHEIHHLVDNRIHPDFFILNENSSISIKESRTLMEKLQKTSSISQRRVMIIDNASNLNRNIQNSFLKILEEPPIDTIFILICNRLDTMPKTLLSRANILHFSPLTKEEVYEILLSHNASPQESAEISEISFGSPGYAVWLLENDGLSILHQLLKAFTLPFKNTNLKNTLELSQKIPFSIIIKMLSYILHNYMNIICKTSNNSAEKKTIQIMGDIVRNNSKTPYEESQKIIEILQMLNKKESLNLDESAILAYVYEKFFSNLG